MIWFINQTRAAANPSDRLSPDESTKQTMARWPRRTWTTFYTYAVMFIGFPILCYLAYAWVRGELF